MITKIYGVYGYREACITIPVSRDGRSYLKVSFVNGNPQHGLNYRPATYVCADKVEQSMIENSILFGGTIKLVRQFGEEDPEPEKKAVAPSKDEDAKQAEDTEAGKELKEFPDVTTIDELRQILKANGAKAPTLTSESAMMRWAENHGLSFPNLVL